jgi:hypothetical protein
MNTATKAVSARKEASDMIGANHAATVALSALAATNAITHPASARTSRAKPRIKLTITDAAMIVSTT